MRVFLKNLFTFLVPVIIFMSVADFVMSKALMKSNEYTGDIEVWNDIYKGNIQADLAIYGSSRAWVHFNSKILKDNLNLSVYNLGIDGQRIDIQYLRHLKYLENNPLPKYVIISLDVFSISKGSNPYNFDQFIPMMYLDGEIYKYTRDYNYFSNTDFIIPLIRYYGNYNAIREARQNILYKSNFKKRDHGFRGQELKWNNDLEEAQKETKLTIAEFDENKYQLFQKMLQELQKENIKVLFVYSPEYKEGQRFVKNRKEVIALYSKLASMYNISFIDYSNHPITKDQSFYYNATHLNAKGADAFTKDLSDSLRIYWNRN